MPEVDTYYASLRLDGKLALDGRVFADGEWNAEPDRVEWRVGGFACLVSRNRMGAWCGYVAVPPGHPWHGKHYNASGLDSVRVHGGLTYAQSCNGLVCHVPRPGESDDVWWLGFDCSHAGDLVPAMSKRWRLDCETYRDVEYVREQTERLAAQAKAVAA